MADQFQYLFTPLKIGPVVVRNRIFTPPYETNLVEDEARGWWDRLAHFHADMCCWGLCGAAQDRCCHSRGLFCCPEDLRSSS